MEGMQMQAQAYVKSVQNHADAGMQLEAYKGYADADMKGVQMPVYERDADAKYQGCNCRHI
jgi:hypothetical protein